jgi:peptidoglycan hydrolase-like protein with peptidoglycan-binding domain
MIKQATETYGKVRELTDKIAPGMFDQLKAQVAPDDPLAKGGDDGSYSATWLQESLNELLDAGLEVDGDIGEMTRKAIRMFQEEEDLEVDGWAGAGTCARILQRLEEKKKKKARLAEQPA